MEARLPVNVLFRSDSGPLKGFTSASFRVAISEEGVGDLVGPPELVDQISGDIVCTVDGVDVFSWRPEDRDFTYGDADQVTISGRGPASFFERAIVLPESFPSFTTRTRTFSGAPFEALATLITEAQSRGRLVGVSPTWTSTLDSNGDPWTVTLNINVEAGRTLRELLDEFIEVAGVEWRLAGDGTFDAAPTLGTDKSASVVLFEGRDQLSRSRTVSTRDQRKTVYLSTSTGVSVAEVAGLEDNAGEIWLDGQDYSDPTSRDQVAAQLSEKLGETPQEVNLTISPDSGAFTRFAPGDIIGLDTGEESPEPVRVVGISVSVTDSTNVELSLVDEIPLRVKRIDNAIESRADARLSAPSAVQARTLLTPADRLESGVVPGTTIMESSNYEEGVDGWLIDGGGNVEFNNAIFRGDLESSNYVEGVSGWRLDNDGNAELNEGEFRGLITGSAFTTDDGSGDGHIVISGDAALDPESPGVNQIAFIPDDSFGSFVSPALIQVLDTGGMTLTSVATNSSTDASALLLKTNGVNLVAGPNGFQGIALDAEDGPIEFFPSNSSNAKVYGDFEVTGTITGDLATGTYSGITGTGALNAGSITSGFGNINIGSSTFTGNGSGLTNLPIPPLPNNPTFNSVRVNDSLFFDSSSFPRFEEDGSGVMLRGAGQLRMKFDGGFRIEDGPLNFDGGSISVAGNASLQSVSAITVTANVGLFTDENDTTGFATNARINTSSGRVQRSTSSRRYKQDITNAPPLDRLLDIQPRSYRSIRDVKENGPNATVLYGAIAEELHDLGLSNLVEYIDGKPEAIHYQLIGVALIPYVRELQNRIDQLERTNGS